MKRKPFLILQISVILLSLLGMHLLVAAGLANDASVDYLSFNPDWYFESGQSGAELGTAVHTAGDLDGDGFDDIVIGAPFYIAPGATEKDGAAFLFYGSGSSTPLANTEDLLLTIGKKGSRFGSAVDSAGDVDGDGYADLLVGAYEYQVSFPDTNGDPKSGAVFLYLGSKDGIDDTPSWSFIAEAPEIQLGYSLAAAGDVNGDDYDDILIGAPGFDSPDLSNEGKAYLFLGSPDGLSANPAWTFQCALAAASCGLSVASAGDLNKDGYDDIVIGAPHYNNPDIDEGAAFVFFGSKDGPSQAPDGLLQSNQPGAEFGAAVASAGDLNGDGCADLVIGAPEFDRDEINLDFGAAFIYLGSPSGIRADSNWIIQGPEAYSRFGDSLHAAGDINLDGFSDVLIGAYLYGDYGGFDQPDEGAVFLYTGSPAGLTLSPSWFAYGNKAEAWFGFSAAPAGDVNGDGGVDLIIGAPQYRYDQKIVMGRAFVYLNTLEEFIKYYYRVFIPITIID